MTALVKGLIFRMRESSFTQEELVHYIEEDLDIAPEAASVAIRELVSEGVLHRVSGKLFLSSALDLLAGRIDVKPQGYGFVDIEGEDEDIFIPQGKMNGAMHDDKVLVKWQRKKGKSEGEVVSIIDRRVKNIVGTYMKSKGGAFVIPDDARLGNQIDVSYLHEKGSNRNIAPGDKVVIRLEDDGKARIIENLGENKTVGVDILSIIRSYNLYQEFPKAVEDEARTVAIPIPESEIERRLDLRKEQVITIDPIDAKDLDDAVHLKKNSAGLWELGVHIADVAHYVAEGGKLDEEAYKRGTSVYFPDRVIPMLPKQLSNNICSLIPHQDRLTLSVIMTLDPNGDVVDFKVCESVINIGARFDYGLAQKLLDGDRPEAHHKKFIPMLHDMAELTKAIEKTRAARGEVVFDVPEPKIILDEETGKIKDVIAYPHYLSHRIIETFMILCNEVVAKKMHNLEMPFIYRIHENPVPEKISRLVDALKPFAVTHGITPGTATGKVYQKMLDGLEGEVRQIISTIALRSMQKAKYSEKNIGHFGLGATHYCHFTSPIRRYPDLVIHRIIKMMLNRKLSSHKMEEMHSFVADAAVQSSKTELAATEAEREVLNLKRAEYMQDKIGEAFTGTISGIQDFGVFVYLPNTVEGLIRIENMPPDNYTYHEKHMTLVGRKRTFKMGDKIEVIVAGVNMPRRQVEFAAKLP